MSSNIVPTYGVIHIGSVDTTNADLAEYYVAGDPSIAEGDVVALTSMRISDNDGRTVANKGVLRLASEAYDQQAIGIVSTAPGVMLGTIDSINGNRGDCKLALAGRVPTRVSVENGPIQVGDRLTASSTPGVAMRATRPGRCIGIALESFADEEGFREGRVMVFVRADWYVGDNIAGGETVQQGDVDPLLDARGDLATAYRGQLLVAEQVQRLAKAETRSALAQLQQKLSELEALVRSSHAEAAALPTARLAVTHCAVEAAAGTGAQALLTAGASDLAGTVALITGSGSWVAGAQLQVRFATPYAIAPRVTLTPAHAGIAAQAAARGVSVEATSAGFTIRFATAEAAATGYAWNYLVLPAGSAVDPGEHLLP